MSSTISVIAAVNNDSILNANLMRSPMIASGDVPLFIERGHRSASKAYNEGLRKTTSDLVVFAHQDAYFPQGWEERLLRATKSLDESGEPWGALGVFGVTVDKRYIGRIWSEGNQQEFIGGDLRRPQEIVSFDEVVLVLKKSTGFQFDEKLPGYHLYGTDIVLDLSVSGYKSYVFDGPVIHNSRTIVRLDPNYTDCYRYMQKKWASRLPMTTCIMDLTNSSWPLWNFRLRSTIRRIVGRKKPISNHYCDPQKVASRLSYDLAPEGRTL